MMKLGALYNTVNARSGVLITPVLYHGPGHTIMNTLALQAGRTIVPRYWSELNQAVDIRHFSETGLVLTTTTAAQRKESAIDGDCINNLNDSDIEGSLCLFFTMYGNLLV